MIIGVPGETYPGERRVALVPAVLGNLAKAGLQVLVEAGAGAAAGYPDTEYSDKGAKIAASRAEVFAQAEIVTQVLCHGANDKTGQADLPMLRSGQILVGFLRPLGSLQILQELAATGVSSFAVELMPRTTRAQSMDALSSMATMSGYKAVILAADTLPRIFPMLTTAAGTITPGRVLIIGVGVAGLQAIATARRLGAVAANDVVVTAAVIPGKKAPILVTKEMVARMLPGSVIVDLAAERGGNCELTRAGETVVEHGVTIIGETNLASTVPYHASQMYARNLSAFLLNLVKDGKFQFNEADEIHRETLLTRDGEIVNPRVREFLGLPARSAEKPTGA